MSFIHFFFPQLWQMQCIPFIRWSHLTFRKIFTSTFVGDQRMVSCTWIRGVMFSSPAFPHCIQTLNQKTLFPLNLLVHLVTLSDKRTTSFYLKKEMARSCLVRNQILLHVLPFEENMNSSLLNINFKILVFGY